MALVVSVWRLSFSCCDQVAKLGLDFQPLVRRQRSVDYKLLNPCEASKESHSNCSCLYFFPIVPGVPGSSFLSGTGII